MKWGQRGQAYKTYGQCKAITWETRQMTGVKEEVTTKTQWEGNQNKRPKVRAFKNIGRKVGHSEYRNTVQTTWEIRLMTGVRIRSDQSTTNLVHQPALSLSLWNHLVSQSLRKGIWMEPMAERGGENYRWNFIGWSLSTSASSTRVQLIPRRTECLLGVFVPTLYLNDELRSLISEELSPHLVV